MTVTVRRFPGLLEPTVRRRGPLTESSGFWVKLRPSSQGKHTAMGIVYQFILTAVSAPFIAAGWVALMRWQMAPAETNTIAVLPAAYSLGEVIIPVEMLDMATELCEAADLVTPMARAYGVRIELAIRPGTAGRADQAALRTALRKALKTSVRAADGGRVLLSALREGPELKIQITDDGPEVGDRSRDPEILEAATLVGSQGGLLLVETRADRGPTVTIRLPSPEEGQDVEQRMAAQRMKQPVG